MGKHPVALQHLLVFALFRQAFGNCLVLLVGFLRETAQHHRVHIVPQGLNGTGQATQFGFLVLVEEVGHDHAGFVQHGTANGDAGSQTHPLPRDRAAGIQFAALLRQSAQIAGGHEVGQDHRRRFQRLDLFFDERLGLSPLHRNDAETTTGAFHRHAHEGVEVVLARFGNILEGRMRVGVAGVQRFAGFGNGPHQPLADAQFRPVNGFRRQAFRGEQFQHIVFTQHIDGANLRRQRACDLLHDAVQTLLRTQLLGHRLAQMAQQNARPFRGDRSCPGRAGLHCDILLPVAPGGIASGLVRLR